MVFIRKKRQSNRKPLSELDDFDQKNIIGVSVRDRQENARVIHSTGDQEFTVDNPGSNLASNENLVMVKTLERCFNETIDKEMDNLVDDVEDRIQNAFLIANDRNIIPKISLAVKSLNTSSGRDATSVMVSSEFGEHIRITAPFENAFEKNNTLNAFNTNDETRINFPDKVGELSVPGTHFERQPHIYHNHPKKTNRSTPKVKQFVSFRQRSKVETVPTVGAHSV